MVCVRSVSVNTTEEGSSQLPKCLVNLTFWLVNLMSTCHNVIVFKQFIVRINRYKQTIVKLSNIVTIVSASATIVIVETHYHSTNAHQSTLVHLQYLQPMQSTNNPHLLKQGTRLRPD